MDWVTQNTEIEKLDWSALANNAVSVVGNSLSTILNSAVSAIGSITNAVFNAFIAIVFAIYCLFQKETLARQGRKLLYAFFPETFADNVVRILRLANSTFSNFLSGQCIEVCILGSMFAISMALFRMPYIPLVSVLVAVTAFIPIVGAWIGCVFGAFLILVANPIQAVWFVVLFLVLQQIENNLIYPRVVGTSIGLNGMWVLLAVAVGGEIMGVAGMFLMIPITSVLYTLLSEITNKFLESKEIDPDKLKAQPPELRSRLKDKIGKKKAAKQQNESQETQDEVPKTDEN
jgi:predicted PurR-regulated permease PerM